MITKQRGLIHACANDLLPSVKYLLHVSELLLNIISFIKDAKVPMDYNAKVSFTSAVKTQKFQIVLEFDLISNLLVNSLNITLI